MKAILRIQKLKSYAQIAGVENHNNRVNPTLNADPNIVNKKLIGCESAVDSIKMLLLKHNIKPRSNAVLAVEYLLTASPEAFTGKNAIDKKPWVKANIDFLRKKHGSGLIEVYWHRDESVEHLHCLVVPIIKDEGGKARLSAKDFFGGRARLSQLQTQYASRMARFGLERGVQGSQARHKTVKQFYSELNARSQNAIKKVNYSLKDNHSVSLFNYKNQHEELTSNIQQLTYVITENEQLKTERKALMQRIDRAETNLKNVRAEYYSMKKVVGNHSTEFIKSLLKWAHSFLYDPDAPDLKRDEREKSMTKVLSCDVRAKALTERWAHVVRLLAKGEDYSELNLKK